MWVMIVLILDHCLSIYFVWIYNYVKHKRSDGEILVNMTQF